MRKCIILLCLFSASLYAQKDLGIIKLNENFSSTLIFSSPANQIIFGNNPQVSETPDGTPIFKYYQIFVSDSTGTVNIRAKKNVPTTSITVILKNNEIFVGKIGYDSVYSGTPYVFVPKDKPVVSKDSLIKKQLQEEWVKKLDYLLDQKTQFNTVGEIKNHMSFQLSNLMNDENYTYVKFIIKNNTANEFKLDGITFKYEEGKRKSINKKEVKNREYVNPVYQTSKNKIEAYSEEIIGVVIPLFSINENGYLVIQFLEKTGTRDYRIDIKEGEITQIQTFQNIDWKNYSNDTRPYPLITLRHVMGSNTVGISGGASLQSFSGALSYRHYFRRKLFVEPFLEYEKINFNYSSTDAIRVAGKLNHTVAKAADIFFLNLHYGVFAGNEISKIDELSMNNSKFNSGMLVGANAELYLYKNMFLSLFIDQRLNFTSSLGRWWWIGGIGFNIVL